MLAGLMAVATSLLANLDDPVLVEFFRAPGCRECRLVNTEVLPAIQEQFGGIYRIEEYDVGIMEHTARLAAYQEALGIAGNEPVCMVVDYRKVLNGYQAIRDGLRESIHEALAARQDVDWQMPESPVPSPDQASRPYAQAQQRPLTMTFPVVLGAGLADGINPCAISMLVFLMSILSVAKVRGAGLVAMGGAYCVAAFLTYTAIGFGVLRVLHLSRGFPLVQAGIESITIVILGVLAYLSFRDAYKFWRHEIVSEVVLQLPEGVKRRIRALIMARLNLRHLAVSGFLLGAGVTALESICTGQLYVPVLVLLIKSGLAGLREWLYLLGYNAAFVLPLVAVFVAVGLGMHTPSLLAWSKRNVVLSKIILGAFFLTIAGLLHLL
ncbi:MAG: hypothetical protein A2498_01605 [Lentisphaerae bacterium RIFOXYC12_FULL_60_16]|nr:MAG: hypothetical protein A2498_01605 [Lentisphaerae bacterium RIFOXYC12_FULL_60_16]OGV85151.1 MAG: hypothetical protein A2340_01130 [Lentisphaerae bacterium RIFOXYB12_FULL_60_10]